MMSNGIVIAPKNAQGERDGIKKKPCMSVLEDQNKLSLEKDKTMCNLQPLKLLLTSWDFHTRQSLEFTQPCAV
ncbi:hypothetical protein AMELA_G00273000 [Ameiurus melas]|uniref:Uncharacterized protein n=1 Tax=Ameiurus melas TaxID=219545 RepID=A0A7J5ZND2_AMEME|nr:hypothetical protein AMELA_G00273000 [Ameiurus melas]